MNKCEVQKFSFIQIHELILTLLKCGFEMIGRKILFSIHNTNYFNVESLNFIFLNPSATFFSCFFFLLKYEVKTPLNL